MQSGWAGGPTTLGAADSATDLWDGTLAGRHQDRRSAGTFSWSIQYTLELNSDGFVESDP